MFLVKVATEMMCCPCCAMMPNMGFCSTFSKNRDNTSSLITDY